MRAAQQQLGAEWTESRARERIRRRTVAREMIGDELGGAAAIAERETDAAAGHRRNMARGIADEKHIGGGERRDRAADRE